MNRYEELQKLEVPPIVPPSVEEILLPASLAISKENKIFYRELNRSIWDYFEDRFPDANINMNKSDLATILNRKAVRPELINKLMAIIHQCETGVYTNADMNVNKSELLHQSKQTLEAIDNS